MSESPRTHPTRIDSDEARSRLKEAILEAGGNPYDSECLWPLQAKETYERYVELDKQRWDRQRQILEKLGLDPSNLNLPGDARFGAPRNLGYQITAANEQEADEELTRRFGPPDHDRLKAARDVIAECDENGPTPVAVPVGWDESSLDVPDFPVETADDVAMWLQSRLNELRAMAAPSLAAGGSKTGDQDVFTRVFLNRAIDTVRHAYLLVEALGFLDAPPQTVPADAPAAEAEIGNLIRWLKLRDDSGTPLSERESNILEGMLGLGAVDSDNRKTAAEIAVVADGPQADPNSFKEPISNLRRAGLVGTKEGRGGGAWLTPDGKARAKKLKKL